MKESSNRSNENAGEKEDRGQPHCFPLNWPDWRLTDHQDYLH
jgi:hypothetical protein